MSTGPTGMSTPTLYMSVAGNALFAMDATNGNILATLPTGGVGHLVPSPTQYILYQTRLESFKAIDPITNTIIQTTPITANQGGLSAISTDGNFLYYYVSIGQKLGVFDVNSFTTVATYNNIFPSIPAKFVTSSDGLFLYATIPGVFPSTTSSVLQISLTSFTVTNTYSSIPGKVYSLAILPNNSSIYVGSNDGNVRAIDVSTGSVTVIPVSGYTTGTFKMNPLGTFLYIGASSTGTHVMSMATNTVTATIANPTGYGVTQSISISGDSQTVYLCSHISKILVVDASTNTVTQTFAIPSSNTSIMLSALIE